jgi:hypothetical protein
MAPKSCFLTQIILYLWSVLILAQDIPSRPTVDSMTMIGPGCPIGSGGMATEIRNSTPVFMFTEWYLNLADADLTAEYPSVSKFCQETINLAHATPGYQVRIAAVTIGGWADLDDSTEIEIEVDTRLGAEQAGVCSDI